MSTTHRPTDQQQTSQPRTTDEQDTAASGDRRTGAPRTFSSTNRRPLPPTFGDEQWATGEP
ncbi:hypothetical protein [Salinigranum salinum]|uniref:hypothetical protein n=1 Tax=Salinigranum salinum TaxID=1364937 RepID=UPI001260707D|nr:hypothetical protein [Salinigranum salinum]